MPRYERFASIRQGLFEIILDTLWVSHSAILFNQDDPDLYSTVLSGKRPCFRDCNKSYVDQFVITASIGIIKIIHVIDDLSNDAVIQYLN